MHVKFGVLKTIYERKGTYRIFEKYYVVQYITHIHFYKIKKNTLMLI